MNNDMVSRIVPACFGVEIIQCLVNFTWFGDHPLFDGLKISIQPSHPALYPSRITTHLPRALISIFYVTLPILYPKDEMYPRMTLEKICVLA